MRESLIRGGGGGYANHPTAPSSTSPATAAAASSRARREASLAQIVRFDRAPWGWVILPIVKGDPLRIELFRAERGVSRVEIESIGLKGMPYGVWHNMVSWTLYVSGGGTQDFVASSGVGVAGVAATDRDAGLRGASLGSLTRPAPASIELSSEQVLELAILDYSNVSLGPVPLTVHARVQGLIYYGGGA